MIDEQPPPNDAADRGAALGAGTRMLTAAIAAALGVASAIRRLASRGATAIAWLGAALDALTGYVRAHVLRRAARVLAPLVVAIAFALSRLGRVIRAVAVLARRLGSAASRRVRPWLEAASRGSSAVAAVVIAALKRWGAIPLRLGLRLGGTVQRGTARVARAACTRLKPVWRAAVAALVPAGRVARALLVSAARAARALLAPAARAARALLAPAAGRVVAGLARLAAPVRLACRRLCARLGRVGGPAARRVHRLGTRAGQRAVHSVRVAATKALARRLAVAPGAPTESWPATARSRQARVPMVRFAMATSHNEYLAAGATAVDAIVTVTAVGGSGPDAPERAEVILLDCSGSMAYPMSKLDAARAATAAAIDAMDDGTWFAVVRATHLAEQVYPPAGLVQASPDTRREVMRALRLLWPEGGTAMGKWLLAARDLLATRPSAIGHAILLTDGRDESESPAALDAALRACRGAFQCDCRGVGTDWSVDELRRVAEAMLGTVDIVSEPAGLEEDFRSMTRVSMARQTAGVALRIWTPKGATVHTFKQVSPAIAELDGARVPIDESTADYPTGAWGAEARSYQLRVALPGGCRPGAELLAARLTLLIAGEPNARALVTATWSEESELTARIDPEVAHYSGQSELAAAIRDGLEARRARDEAAATVKLGRAVQLATESGNEPTLKLLEAVVDVEDAEAGTVRLRAEIDDGDEMALDTRSVKTVAGPSARRTADPDRPVCGPGATACLGPGRGLGSWGH